MEAGFIGTGSMGSLLVEAFIRSGAIPAQQIAVCNRTPVKAERLAAMLPGLTVAPSNREAARGKRFVFLCVRPLDFAPIIEEIRPAVTPEQIIVSITSPVMVADLEARLPCKIAKVIPSITNRVFSGVSLCVYGERMNDEDRASLDRLLDSISSPFAIPEAYTRVASDISSCGPAFFALLLRRFAEAAVAETGIPAEQADRLAAGMLLGTGRLLTEGGLTPQELERCVAVPGGITAEGLRLLDAELDGVFPKLFRITHDKYREDVGKVAARFSRPPD